MDMVLGLMLMNGLDRPSFGISTDIFGDFFLGSREEQPAVSRLQHVIMFSFVVFIYTNILEVKCVLCSNRN